jgi:hypothetical protein
MAVERVGVGRKETSPIARMALDQNEELSYWLGYRVCAKGPRMQYGLVTVLTAIFFSVAAPASELTQVERVQAALDTWLTARAPIEKVTGIAAYISFGAAGPAIESYAGKVGRDPDAGPVDQYTLFQMGSTSTPSR